MCDKSNTEDKAGSGLYNLPCQADLELSKGELIKGN